MFILEILLSLSLWLAVFLPVNSYVLSLKDISPYKIIQSISDKNIFDYTKIQQETSMMRQNVCRVDFVKDVFTIAFSSLYLDTHQIQVKSTSTEAVSLISDGSNLFVALNSASTTDYDIVAFNINNLSKPLDSIDTGPGLLGVSIIGKNIFAINSSVNSAIQKISFDYVQNKLVKTADYKIPYSSSNNPVYASKISSMYPYLLIGLKKNDNEELIVSDVNKIDLGFQNSIYSKIEFDSSVQEVWPFYDGYSHAFISTAKEPEINDLCINCSTSQNSTSTSVVSSYDIAGSLGNVKSLIEKDGTIFVGRSSGNQELFKIATTRDYSSSTNTSYSYNVIDSTDVDDGVYSMLLLNDSLFTSSGKNNSKIQIRSIDKISNVLKSVNTNISISDLECVGGRFFGSGTIYKMNGTSTESMSPVLFEIKGIK